MDDDIKKKISKDFGLESMDSREQERMIEKIGNLLFESVAERAIDEMDEDAMGRFDGVIEGAGEDYQKIISFFKENVPSFDKIVSDELKRLQKATSGIFS